MQSLIKPIFVSSDLKRTEEFYHTIFDFQTSKMFEDYLIMGTETMELHFTKLSKINQKKNHCACYIAVDDVEELYAHCLTHQCVHSNGKLTEYEWGKEFAVLDPDWNLIKITAQ